MKKNAIGILLCLCVTAAGLTGPVSASSETWSGESSMTESVTEQMQTDPAEETKSEETSAGSETDTEDEMETGTEGEMETGTETEAGKTEEVLETEELPGGMDAVYTSSDDDNMEATVQGSHISWSGDGTQANPFFAASDCNDYSTDSVLIQTVNPLEKLDDGSSQKTVSVNCGWNDITFTVTSADGEKTAYYLMRWQRMKENRTEFLKETDVYALPSAADASNGGIGGLRLNEYYDYKLETASEWISVNGVDRITDLAPGVYTIRYGESPTLMAQDSNFVTVNVEIADAVRIKCSDARIILKKSSASIGERVDFTIVLDPDEWVEQVVFRDIYLSAGAYSNSPILPVLSHYTSDDAHNYYHGYFIMSTFKFPCSNRYVEFENKWGLETFKGSVYSITQDVPSNTTVSIEPDNAADSFKVNGETYYKEASQVTITVTANESPGIAGLKSFTVYNEDGTAVAESTDGSAVTLTVNSNLRIGNVVMEYIRADYTAVEEALAKVPSDLSVYTPESVAALKAAVAAVVRDKNIEEQSEVDAMAEAVEKAIAGLVPMPETETETETETEAETEDDTDKETETETEKKTGQTGGAAGRTNEVKNVKASPDTADDTPIGAWCSLLLISGASVLAVLKKRKKA